MKKVIVIPPKPPEPKKLESCSLLLYQYIESDSEGSFDWQIKSYTKVISEHSDWIFASVFYDVGKSGFSGED